MSRFCLHSNLKTPRIPCCGILGCVQESELMKILDDADDCILDCPKQTTDFSPW